MPASPPMRTSEPCPASPPVSASRKTTSSDSRPMSGAVGPCGGGGVALDMAYHKARRRSRRAGGTDCDAASIAAPLAAIFVDLVVGTRPGNREKDLQILVPRHQVRLLQRQ